LLELKVAGTLTPLKDVVTRGDRVEEGERGHVRPAGQEQFLERGGEPGSVPPLAVNSIVQRVQGASELLVTQRRLLRARLQRGDRRLELLDRGSLLLELIRDKLRLLFEQTELLLLDLRQFLLLVAPLRRGKLLLECPGRPLERLDLLLLRLDL